MASVTLTDLWVHDADNLSDFIRFPARGSEARTLATPGEVRTYGNGRRRLITREGQDRGLQVDLEDATNAQINWLDERIARVVMVRDVVGLLVFGTYLSNPAVPVYPQGRWTTTLEVQMLTFDPMFDDGLTPAAELVDSVTPPLLSGGGGYRGGY